MRAPVVLAVLTCGLAACGSSPEPKVPVLAKGPPLALIEVADGFAAPVQLVGAPGDAERLYVVDQEGRVLVLAGGRVREEPFLDVRRLVAYGGEQGLLSLAFHPDYAENRRLYLLYTNRAGDTRVVEYRSDGERVLPETARVLLAVDQPYDNHNGGQLALGPDGALYLGLGDGGDARDPEERGQDLGTRLGKLLRLEVDEPGAKWEIAGVGLRNPWRYSFDRTAGRLWIADVGQEEWEEINVVPTPLEGVPNFGWDAYEGFESFEDTELAPETRLVEPLVVYSHAEGCSVIGGPVYRGDQVPALRGRYVFGDFCSGKVWSLPVSGPPQRRLERINVPQLVAFGEDQDGALYVVSLAGSIYRIAAVES